MTRISILPLAVKIAFICAIACMSLTANAMPAWPGWLIHQQSDGTTLTYRLIGDEHVHGFVTTDGYLLANDVRPMLRHDQPRRSTSQHGCGGTCARKANGNRNETLAESIQTEDTLRRSHRPKSTVGAKH